MPIRSEYNCTKFCTGHVTHVLRSWKRKREPCNIQNVTSIGVIPQRGLNESP